MLTCWNECCEMSNLWIIRTCLQAHMKTRKNDASWILIEIQFVSCLIAFDWNFKFQQNWKDGLELDFESAVVFKATLALPKSSMELIPNKCEVWFPIWNSFDAICKRCFFLIDCNTTSFRFPNILFPKSHKSLPTIIQYTKYSNIVWSIQIWSNSV